MIYSTVTAATNPTREIRIHLAKHSHQRSVTKSSEDRRQCGQTCKQTMRANVASNSTPQSFKLNILLCLWGLFPVTSEVDFTSLYFYYFISNKVPLHTYTTLCIYKYASKALISSLNKKFYFLNEMSITPHLSKWADIREPCSISCQSSVRLD